MATHSWTVSSPGNAESHSRFRLPPMPPLRSGVWLLSFVTFVSFCSRFVRASDWRQRHFPTRRSPSEAAGRSLRHREIASAAGRHFAAGLGQSELPSSMQVRAVSTLVGMARGNELVPAGSRLIMRSPGFTGRWRFARIYRLIIQHEWPVSRRFGSRKTGDLRSRLGRVQRAHGRRSGSRAQQVETV